MNPSDESQSGARPEHLREGWTIAIEVSNPSVAGAHEPGESRFGPGVSLGRAGGLSNTIEHVDTQWLDAGARSDDGLMPAVAALCGRHGITARDLANIAVCTGPGGFTGLRVAVTAAQCIALATGARVVDVGAHAGALASVWDEVGALARAREGHACAVGVGLASKGDAVSVAWAIVRGGDAFDGAVVDQLERAESMDDAGVRERGPAVFVGDAHLPESVRSAVLDGGGSVCSPRLSPEVLLTLAPLGRVVDAAALRPRYAREPEAVRLWRERHG